MVFFVVLHHSILPPVIIGFLANQRGFFIALQYSRPVIENSCWRLGYD
jgi:hypothetical protein